MGVESAQEKNQPCAGFTLVEILLATIIGAMITVAAFAVFRSVTGNRDTLEYYAKIMANGRYALNLIRDDLANFYRAEDPEMMRLRGVKRDVEGKSADRLIIYVVSEQKVRKAAQEGDVYEVEYGISEDTEKGISFLARRCGAVEDKIIGNSGGIMTRVARYIDELKFEYFDGRDWQRQWQQTDLPQRVRVTLKLLNAEGNHSSIEMSQEVSLPMWLQSSDATGTGEYGNID
ncbi:MAG: prepilin-type N-terminal cleavage/methylation domain-containing protein [Sedimentisphaerales bacterium]|nr:prepilin-type N-terminal cleavage/methylation domain-containing protein [Sedimentisphaerales bacterium]